MAQLTHIRRSRTNRAIRRRRRAKISSKPQAHSPPWKHPPRGLTTRSRLYTVINLTLCHLGSCVYNQRPAAVLLAAVHWEARVLMRLSRPQLYAPRDSPTLLAPTTATSFPLFALQSLSMPPYFPILRNERRPIPLRRNLHPPTHPPCMRPQVVRYEILSKLLDRAVASYTHDVRWNAIRNIGYGCA